MKATKFFAMFLMAMATMVSFSSCSDDDDNNGDNSGEVVAASIVGKWEYSESGVTKTLTFEASGKGTASYKSSSQEYTETFYYNYDGEEAELLLRKCSVLGRTYYSSVVISSSSLHLGGETYDRKSGGSGAKSVVGSILGTWKEIDEEDGTTLTFVFSAGGEGTLTIVDRSSSSSQKFSYNYSAKNKTLTIAGAGNLDGEYYNIVVTSDHLFIGGLELEK